MIASQTVEHVEAVDFDPRELVRARRVAEYWEGRSTFHVRMRDGRTGCVVFQSGVFVEAIAMPRPERVREC